MNVLFLVLIAIPLGAYLVLLVMNTGDLGGDEKQAEPVHTSADAVLSDTPTETAAAPAAVAIAAIEPTAESVMAEEEAEVASEAATTPVEPTAPIVAASVMLVTEATGAHDETIAPVVAEDAMSAAAEPRTSSKESLAPIVAESVVAVEVIAAEPSSAPAETTAAIADEALSTAVKETTAVAAASLDPQIIEPTIAAAALTLPIDDQQIESVKVPAQDEVAVIETPVPVAKPSPVVPPASVTLAETVTAETKEPEEPIPPEGPVVLPTKGTPKYAFDYRGRLWVEKKQKGFFRQLRRPLLPPDEPPNNSGR